MTSLEPCLQGAARHDRIQVVVIEQFQQSPATAGIRVKNEHLLPVAAAGRAILEFTSYLTTDALGLAVPARREVSALDQEQPVFDVATMDRRLATSLAPQRLDTWLLTAFGLVALVLAASGIFAIVSYYVAQHTHEIGVRMALGASRSQILELVLHGAMIPASVGIAIGTVSALLLTRFISRMLFGIQPSDIASFAAASAVLVITACLATYIPSRRAISLDPVVALRYE